MAGGIQRLVAQSFKYLPSGIRGKLAGDPVIIDGRELDPLFQIFWNQGQSQAGAALTVDGMRAGIRVGADLLDRKPTSMAQISDRTLEQDGCSVPVRIFRPKGIGGNAPCLLWFHQGGFVIGGIDCTEGFASYVADQSKCVVISAGYRLAPENKFPAALEDAVAAFTWLATNGNDIGISPDRIVVGGESAGGFLAAHVAQTARTSGNTPLAQVLVYPWLLADGQTPSYETFANAYPLGREMMDWFAECVFETAKDRTSPEANPGRAENLEGLAPAFIYPAGFDPLTDEAEDYANKLKSAGCEVTFHRFDALAHAFLGMTGALPAAQNAVDHICDDLRNFLSRA